MPHIRRKANKLDLANVFLGTVKLAGAKTFTASDKDIITEIDLTFKALKGTKPRVNKDKHAYNTKAKQYEFCKIFKPKA